MLLNFFFFFALLLCFFFFFFFSSRRRHTRYIGDWSSDVCSSDLIALVGYEVVGDAIPAPLTDHAGDPVRGRAIVADRRLGLCLLCHSGPFPEVSQQGNLAPSLAGAGRSEERRVGKECRWQGGEAA